MDDILALLQPIAPLISKTILRQLSRGIFEMLAMTGRVTMLGISRWAGKGGSYRTIQRWYSTKLPWAKIFWAIFQKLLWQPGDEYLLAGDEFVVSKAGEATFGKDCIFSSIFQRAIPGLAFFVFSLVNVRRRCSSPIKVEQVVRSAEEKEACKVKAKIRQEKKQPAEKRKPGLPKGSKNKAKQPPELNPEPKRIQTMLTALLELIDGLIPLKYLVMDGHFGNYPSVWMVRQIRLHLISKLRHDAALYLPYSGAKPKRGKYPKYGTKIDYNHLPAELLQQTTTEDDIRTDIYQAKMWNKEFADQINVVIIHKTNLKTLATAHVVLFSTDLKLPFEKMIDYYKLRFQIEFNFRDSKQYWGLEDFMNVEQTPGTNAANLSLLIVNLSQRLLDNYRSDDPAFSVLDLKAQYRGYRYVFETIKMLPQKPDGNLLSAIFLQVAGLGRIHAAQTPVSTVQLAKILCIEEVY
jgi:putative transposase